jgi:hypothetical protein
VALTGWLVDKTALVRLAQSTEAEIWAGRIERGLVCISTVRRPVPSPAWAMTTRSTGC